MRQYAPLKRRLTITLHGSISQKTTLNIILAAVRTWNLTEVLMYVSKWAPGTASWEIKWPKRDLTSHLYPQLRLHLQSSMECTPSSSTTGLQHNRIAAQQACSTEEAINICAHCSVLNRTQNHTIPLFIRRRENKRWRHKNGTQFTVQQNAPQKLPNFLWWELLELKQE
jgi:hypothetical protein